MSLAALKKSIIRANQKINEKVAGVKGTDKGEDYRHMADQIDLYKKHFEELNNRMWEILQPNPNIRAKLNAANAMQKIQGRATNQLYPQSEVDLADSMGKYSKTLISADIYSECLKESGQTFMDIAEMKYANEDKLRDSFFAPIQQNLVDIKEINALRKKCEARRLDFDKVKRDNEKKESEGQQIDEAAVNKARIDFEQSIDLASSEMVKFLNSQPHQIAMLVSMVESMRDYHQQSMDSLTALHSLLSEKHTLSEQTPVKYQLVQNDYMNEKSPCCRALYDFEPENERELGFQDGDIIKLLQKIDNNWFMGEINGRRGHFPINYVEVINPLPEA